MTTKVLDGNKALIQEFIDCLKSGQNTSDKRINDILGDVRCFKIKKVIVMNHNLFIILLK